MHKVIQRTMLVAAVAIMGSIAFAQSTTKTRTGTAYQPQIRATSGSKADVPKGSKPACPKGVCTGLGNGFYLPTDTTDSIISGGTEVFIDRSLGNCATWHNSESSSRNFEQTDSMENLVDQEMSSFGLTGSYKTKVLSVAGDVQLKTKHASDITDTFHSVHMDIKMGKHVVDFKKDPNTCYTASNLNGKFLKQFEALPAMSPSNVGNSTQWAAYVTFLRTFGSHIMTQQVIGSRFQQWESSTLKDEKIEDTLKAKACAEVEGTSAGGGWSVKGCAAYNKKEKLEASRFTAEDKVIVMGGSLEARGDLIKDRTKENLDAFIDSADSGSQAIEFRFAPIWEVLVVTYQQECQRQLSKKMVPAPACENLQRAVTLQAAYEGWTAVKCERLVDGRKAVYQTMEIAGTNALGINTYQCTLSKTGCRTDDDCHLSFWTSTTFCYGAGCIDEAQQQAKGEVSKRDRVRGNQEGSYNQGVNQSCYYKAVSGRCQSDWAGGLPTRQLYVQSAPN